MNFHVICLKYLWIVLLILKSCGSDSTRASTSGESVKTLAGTPTTTCSDTSDAKGNLKIDYTSKIVENEYIVAFKGYYKPQTRVNYIGAALNNSGTQKWKVLSRRNPSSEYPSDFDVVLLEETIHRNGLDALRDHPLVKRVTPQRLVRRTIKYVNHTDEDAFPEYKNFKRKTSSYVSIFFISTSFI